MPAPDEWSVLELLGHLVDAEIVMSGRYRWVLSDDRHLRLLDRPGQWERQGEAASGPWPRFHLDVATMLAGQLSGEVEAKTGSGDMAGLQVLEPLEAVEEAG